MKQIEIQGIRIQYDLFNIKIINSYKVKEKDMLTILEEFRSKAKWAYHRTTKSWLKEWKAHNRLYRLGLFRSHTVDCDLEENEKWYKLLAYQILGR